MTPTANTVAAKRWPTVQFQPREGRTWASSSLVAGGSLSRLAGMLDCSVSAHDCPTDRPRIDQHLRYRRCDRHGDPDNAKHRVAGDDHDDGHPHDQKRSHARPDEEPTRHEFQQSLRGGPLHRAIIARSLPDASGHDRSRPRSSTPAPTPCSQSCAGPECRSGRGAAGRPPLGTNPERNRRSEATDSSKVRTFRLFLDLVAQKDHAVLEPGALDQLQVLPILEDARSLAA